MWLMFARVLICEEANRAMQTYYNKYINMQKTYAYKLYTHVETGMHHSYAPPIFPP